MLKLTFRRFILLALASYISMCVLFVSAMAQIDHQSAVHISSNQIFESLLTPNAIIQMVAGSTLITTIIGVIWHIVSTIVRNFQHWISARRKTFKVNFSQDLSKEEYDLLHSISTGVYCLLVRYGTDQYISALASDQEKYEGRLQNKVIPVTVNFDATGTGVFSLSLPVHKRLGSQFKCFAAAKDTNSVSQLKDFLESCDNLSEVSVSNSVNSNRIYFIVNRFGVVSSVDGINNNMVFPE